MKLARTNNKKTSALILAAGNSTRMGSPKSMLRFDKNHTFLEKIVEVYQQFGCKEIIVVLNSQTAEILKKSESKIIDKKQIAINPFSERERFLSIQTGIKALKNPENVFIHPVDNPFINLKVLEALLENSNKSDYQVPYYQGKGGHPILISKNLVKKICDSTECDVNFKIFLNQFIRCFIDTDKSEILININTLDEYMINFKNIF
jgi:molybdenum cofactor cytidylyltransferase